MNGQDAELLAKFYETYPKVKEFHVMVKKRVSDRYKLEDKRCRGIHADRYEIRPPMGDPKEFAFAKKWESHHDRISGMHGLLGTLLGDGLKAVEPSKRDHLVAATVIQWLGSPVGQRFLSEVLGHDVRRPTGR